MDDPITVERRIPASPQVVYQYLSVPELIARWLGQASTIEATPGGAFRLVSPDEHVAEGTVTAVSPSEGISFTWGWQDHPRIPPGSTEVRIDLIPDGEGTIVRLTHSGLPVDDRDLHRTGWTGYLDQLTSALD